LAIEMLINFKVIKKIINLLFIMSYFIYRARYPLPDFELNQLMLFCEIFFILFFYSVSFKDFILKDVFVYLFILILIILHILYIYLLIYENDKIISMIVSSFRLYTYFFVIYIFAKYFFSPKVFIQYLLIFSSIVSIVANITIYLKVNFLVDYAYGYARPIALFSEPSSFAPIVSFLLLYGLYKKKLYIILLSLITLINVNSGLTTAIAMISFLIYYFHKLSFKYLILFLSILIIVVYILLNYSDISHYHSIERIIYMLESFDIEQGHLGQARIATLYNIYIFLVDSNNILFGTGLNSAKSIHYLNDSYNEFSFLHIVFHSFGILGVSCYFLLVTYVYKKLLNNKNNQLLFILYVPFLLSAISNSAEGSLLYQFHLVIIFYVFFNKNHTRNQKCSS